MVVEMADNELRAAMKAAISDQGESNNATIDDCDSYASIYTPAPALASSRYNRQMLIPSISLPGQHKIATASILIIGLGGLGSPAALYLAGAGISKLGLLDNDQVELSNLHRQVVHNESAVNSGLSKVQSAARSCRSLNSEIDIIPHEMLLDISNSENARNVFEVISAYDIVLDCTDNPATRYLISDLCVLLGKVLVSGAAQKLEGQVTVLNYPLPDSEERGPCYRCLFPTPPSPEMVKSCGEIGILGPVVGTIGTLMASEALRLIVRGVDEARKSTMLMYNAWPSDPRSMFRSFGLRGRRPDCLSCGAADVVAGKGQVKITRDSLLDGSLDYATFCGRTQPVKVLDQDHRITARSFMKGLSSTHDPTDTASWRKPIVIDVRESHEIEMGSKVNHSNPLPFSRFLRQDQGVTELQDIISREKPDAVLFICQQGNDSQIAAQKFIDTQAPTTGDSAAPQPANHKAMFIGDVIGGFASLDKI